MADIPYKSLVIFKAVDNVSRTANKIARNVEQAHDRMENSSKGFEDQLESMGAKFDDITDKSNNFKSVGDIKRKADLNITNYTTNLDTVERETKRTGRTIRESFSFKGIFDDYNRGMRNIARRSENTRIVFGSMARGMLKAVSTIIIPAIASLVSVLATLGAAVGVTAGGVAGLVGAFGVAGMAAGAFGGLVATVLNRYYDEAFQATEASNVFKESLQGIKSAWNGVADAHEDQIFITMASAIDTANYALQEMRPFIDDVVQSVAGMTDEIGEFVRTSPTMDRFFDNINSKGVGVFENIARAVGKFGAGLVDTFNAAMPLIEWASQGFLNLADSFQVWADRMASENGFEDFTNYVKENLPKVGDIFGNVFNGVIDLFAAFGGHSETVLDGLVKMTDQFAEWARTIEDNPAFQEFIDYIERNGPTLLSTIGSIVDILIEFGEAVAPLAEDVLDLTESLTDLTDDLIEAQPWLAQTAAAAITLSGAMRVLKLPIMLVSLAVRMLIGGLISLFNNTKVARVATMLLRGAMTLLAGSLGTVIGVVAALAAGFVLLYQNVEWFQKLVDTVWTWIEDFIKEQVDKIIGWYEYFKEEGNSIFKSAMLAILATVIQGFIEIYLWIERKLAEILANVIAKFIEIKNAIGEKLNQAKMVIQNIWEAIKQTIYQKINEIIASVTAKFLEIKNTITEKLNQAKASVSAIWQSIKQTIYQKISEIVSNIAAKFIEIKNTIQQKLESAKQAVSSKFQQMKQTAIQKVQEIWSNIQSKFQQIKNTIQNKIEQAKNALVNKFNQMKTAAQNKVQQIWNTIKNKFNQIKNTIQQKIQQAKQALVNGFNRMVSNARQKAQEVYNAIKRKISEVPSMVGGFISDAATAVAKKASEMVTAGGELIMGLKQGIQDKASDIAAAAKSVAESAIRAVKKALRIASPSKVMIGFGRFTSQGLADGIADRARKVHRESERLSQSVIKGFGDPQLNAGVDVNGSMRDITAKTQRHLNSNVNVNTPKQRMEVNVNVHADQEWLRTDINHENALDGRLNMMT